MNGQDGPTPYEDRIRPRQRLWEWLAASAAATLLAVLLLVTGWTARLDNLVYDAALRLAPRPASSDILIVAIDERALAEVGGWPWSRQVHAQLVNRLSAAGARAIAYDVLFVEPSADPAADAALGRAIAAAERVCLPVLTEIPGPNGDRFRITPPLAVIAREAGGLGHVSLAFDPDGVSRRANLAEAAGPRSAPHLMTCAATVGAGRAGASVASLPKAQPGEALERRGEVLIPFAGAAGRFRTVSAASLLKGEVPDGFVRGRYVLVGATASGLHDRHGTPLSRRDETLSGVELQANLLEGLLTDRLIRPAPLSLSLAITLALVWIQLAALRLASPRRNLAVALGTMGGAVAISGALLVLARIWIPPAPALVTLLVVFPAWGWLRLQAANSYLLQELDRFAREDGAPTVRETGDVVSRRIDLMQRAVQRARDLRAQAAAAAAQREQMVQLLSHDLRSPQSSILALLEGAEPGAVRSDLEARIAGAARRTLSLADNFVHLAKAESGAVSLEPLDLSDLLDVAMDEAWPLARRAAVRLTRTGAGEPVWTTGDRSLLMRALANLIDNAIKFSPPGGVVEAELRRTETGGRPTAQLAIRDRGPGVAEEDRPALFAPYGRGAGRAAPGVGLGLSLVAEVARRHGGGATCESTPGRGATFILTLPVESGAD
ncbi:MULTISPECIES: CHASE2 domain-containing protein [unclassified Phenylobacterium]|uniref:CHASE2 domain-containing protein n=1 Tax=unclassified Phenylobacterium TaxID=2640670 RepID=UPI00083B952C|nr:MULTISPECIES: CHASE2 domain-containing protein [unclassified Phenylobacterium]